MELGKSDLSKDLEINNPVCFRLSTETNFC